MRYVTHCPSCGTAFKIVDDQLRIAQGWVRCGHCQAVYKAKKTLSIVVDDELPQADSTATAPTTAGASTAHTTAISNAAPAASADATTAPTQEQAKAKTASETPHAPKANTNQPPEQKANAEVGTDTTAKSSTATPNQEANAAAKPAHSGGMIERIAAIIAAKKAAASKALPPPVADTGTTPTAEKTHEASASSADGAQANNASLEFAAPTAHSTKALAAPPALLALTNEPASQEASEPSEAVNTASADTHPTQPESGKAKRNEAENESADSHHQSNTNSAEKHNRPRSSGAATEQDTPAMLEWDALPEAPASAAAQTAVDADAADASAALPSHAVLPWQEGEPFPNPQPVAPVLPAFLQANDASGTPSAVIAQPLDNDPTPTQPEAVTSQGGHTQPTANLASNHAAPKAADESPEAAATETADADTSSDSDTTNADQTSDQAAMQTACTGAVEASSASTQQGEPDSTDGDEAPSPSSANTDACATALAPASAQATPEPTAEAATKEAETEQPPASSAALPSDAASQTPPANVISQKTDEASASVTATAHADSLPEEAKPAAEPAPSTSKGASATVRADTRTTSASTTSAAKAESDAEALLRRRALREQRRLKSKSGTRRKRSSASKSARSKKPRGLKALWQALLRPFKSTSATAPAPAAKPPVQPPALPTQATAKAPAPSSGSKQLPALSANAESAPAAQPQEQEPLHAPHEQTTAKDDTRANTSSTNSASQVEAPASAHAAASSSASASDAPPVHSAPADATATAPVAATTTAAPAPATPATSSDESFAFMRDAQRRAFWRKPLVRASLATGIVLGAFTLAGQWAYQNRSALAARIPLARAAFEALRWPVPPWQNIQAIEIEDSDFLKNPDDSYQLRVSLRNSSTQPVAMPALELALLDDDEQVVTRRVVQADPALPTPHVIAPRGRWDATAEVLVQLPPELAQRGIAGYRVAVFYP